MILYRVYALLNEITLNNWSLWFFKVVLHKCLIELVLFVWLSKLIKLSMLFDEFGFNVMRCRLSCRASLKLVMALLKVCIRVTESGGVILPEDVFGSAEIGSKHSPESPFDIVLVHNHLRSSSFGRSTIEIVKVQLLVLLLLGLL